MRTRVSPGLDRLEVRDEAGAGVGALDEALHPGPVLGALDDHLLDLHLVEDTHVPAQAPLAVRGLRQPLQPDPAMDLVAHGQVDVEQQRLHRGEGPLEVQPRGRAGGVMFATTR